MRNILLISLLCLLSPLASLALTTRITASGEIRGKITDEKTGESIPGAHILLEPGSAGTISDIDGNFFFENIPAGRYRLAVSFISYETTVIDEIKVSEGRSLLLNIALVHSEKQISGVEISARRVTHTDMAVLSALRNSHLVVSGISSQQISRSQDSDAASVVRRIPGVSLVDNRFIMIRGLSERYNASMLNDVNAPSMETDVRSFSFDILPANLIDRILIFKSPSADLPGDFAGGVVKVYTRSAPDKNGIQLSYSTQAEPGSTFSRFQGQNNGKWHWAGFHDGSLSLPESFPKNIRSIATDPVALQRTGQALPNNWTPEESLAGLNHSLHLSLGKNWQSDKLKLGHITAISYSNTRSIDQVNRADFNAYDMDMQRKSYIYRFNDQQFEQQTRSGIIHNWSLQAGPRHTIELRNQYNQLGSSEYVFRSGPHYDFNYNAHNHSFHTLYRGIYNGQLSGSHQLGRKNTLDWTTSYSRAFRDEPDYRRYRSDLDTITHDRTLYVPFGAAASYFLGRFYSEMHESNRSASLRYTHNVTGGRLAGLSPELSAGLFFEDKDRRFDARNLGYVRANMMQFDQSLLDVSIEELFRPENINASSGIRIDEQTNPTDSYSASNLQQAAWLMIKLSPRPKLFFSGGIRMEANRQEMLSHSLTNIPIEVVNHEISLLPSASLSYNFSSDNLIRISYGKTVNRPEFRELAPYGFYDFSYNLVKKGNEFLESAYIQNLDIRWELYPSHTETISVGVFYKFFERPIESSFIDGGGSGGIKTFSYTNAHSAISRGVETEIRKALGTGSRLLWLDGFSLLFNAALVQSNVKLGDAGVSQSRTQRPMQGQSPFMVNAGIFYQNHPSDWQISLLYNIIGQRIFIIGYHSYPDIYEMPRNLLDLTISRSVGKNMEIKAGIRDILNQPVVLMQDANQDGVFDMQTDQVIQRYRPGRRFSLGISMRL